MPSTELASLPCSSLTGIGPKLSAKLAKKNIYSIQDILFHLPLRYQDRTRITPIKFITVGTHAVIEGTIQQTTIKPGKKVQLLCRVADESGSLSLRFFHFTAVQKNQLIPGVRIRCFGELRFAKQGFEMIHPEYQLIAAGQIKQVEENLRPIYPASEGLAQHSLLNLSLQALKWLNEGYLLQELLPVELTEKLQLIKLSDALNYLHRPPPDAQLTLLEAGKHPAQQRLIFEELLAFQLSQLRLKEQVQQIPAYPLKLKNTFTQQFLKNLGFALTNAQQRVVYEITEDLQKPQPMMRLVQGDVGSGKTVVAALGMLAAVESNFQAALMAPTEILAEQHYANFTRWLAPLGLDVALLTGKTPAKKRKEMLAALEKGDVQVVIGTHALFQSDVHFAKLALIVIDEQHRFGVEQRLALLSKGSQDNLIAHQLIMTATPIPRTLAMTCYADLDVSIIDELPQGRIPITTVVLANDKRQDVIERIDIACQQGKQIYWVCTLIEESEALTCQNAEETAAQLKNLLPGVQVGLIHGRMKAQEKDAVMGAFKRGELQLLVATTVIEVGVDVPNASLMIIENPERLGLSQLHQLRGRVGRGNIQSHCVLLYQAPLSEVAKKRLMIMRESQDGFYISEQDLIIRGPGEILGTRQTGSIQFKIADLMRDQYLLPKVKQAAVWLLRHKPEDAARLIERWLKNREQYVGV